MKWLTLSHETPEMHFFYSLGYNDNMFIKFIVLQMNYNDKTRAFIYLKELNDALVGYRVS